MSSNMRSLLAAGLLQATAATASNVLQLDIPATAEGASIEHTSSFSSFSFEPAFWPEFFGNLTTPNDFTFAALQTIHEHGGRPNIRPGGITMDSMIFDPEGGDVVRTTNSEGGVYRTTVGPAYYQSWSNFPNGTQFTSTLNFGNDSLDIARDMAVASVKYQKDKIGFFELGNEPTNYPPSRWDNSTQSYVSQWLNWTSSIDTAVRNEIKNNSLDFSDRWWASSATTDITPLKVRPADIIPAGINSKNQVAEYSIHSYAFATCDPERNALATTPNILNHTGNVHYADTEIVPSAQAALDSGKPWIIGEFNSIACSGQPNVSDTFAQALWTVDTELIYAVRNASAVYLHQGATLVFQSDEQSNTAGDDGSPGFSTYDMLYPRTSSKRGEQRVLPGYSGLLFLAEAFKKAGSRVRALATPEGVSEDYFSAYAFYGEKGVEKLALTNMRPYYANSTSDFSVDVNVAQPRALGRFWVSPRAWVKRLTAPYVDEKDAGNVTWAGQSFREGKGEGEVAVEEVGADGTVSVRGSEAVLVFFDEDEAFGREAKEDDQDPWWKFW